MGLIKMPATEIENDIQYNMSLPDLGLGGWIKGELADDFEKMR